MKQKEDDKMNIFILHKNKNAVKTYRDYYNGEKLGFAKWKLREVPKWMKGGKYNEQRKHFKNVKKTRY